MILPTTQKYEINRLGYFYVMKYPSTNPPKHREKAKVGQAPQLHATGAHRPPPAPATCSLGPIHTKRPTRLRQLPAAPLLLPHSPVPRHPTPDSANTARPFANTAACCSPAGQSASSS
jgi:hypothetical protein